MGCISLLIADRHVQVVRGLTRLLSQQSDFRIVRTCRDGATCIQAIRELRPDIALVGIFMPGLSGLEVVAAVALELLTTRVVFLSASAEDRNLVTAAARGTFGVLPKENEEGNLLQFLRRVASEPRRLPLALADKKPSVRESVGNALTILTDRERQIMHLVSEGLSNKEVSRRLGVCAGTIKVHLHHIYQKLSVSNRTALAALAAQTLVGRRRSAGGNQGNGPFPQTEG